MVHLHTLLMTMQPALGLQKTHLPLPLLPPCCRLWGCQHITNNGLKRLAAAAPPLRRCLVSQPWPLHRLTAGVASRSRPA